MKTYEASAKTKEEAIATGLEALGVSISDVTIEVLDEGSKGLFGLFGSRMAKVRLTVKEVELDPLADLLSDKPAPKPVTRQPRPERKPDVPKPEKKPDAPKPEKKPAEPRPEKKPEAPKADKKPEKKPEPPKAEPAATEAAAEPKPERKPRPAKPRTAKAPKAEQPEKKPEQEKKPLPPKEPVKPIEKPVVTMLADADVTPDSAAGKAQAFLKELTHLMGVDVDVAVGLDEENNVFVKMTGDTLGILIGRRGETLDALQYLTSLKVNRGQEGYTRVTLDTENYRAKREDTLVRLANRMANRAVKTGRKVSLEPMNPYERRIIHSALQANEAVDTHSEGDEPNRHVVITLRK
ncbi:MAG: RNA-binding cell elongation regulator Jag/EloR [Aristaeellaceae bacterium]